MDDLILLFAAMVRGNGEEEIFGSLFLWIYGTDLLPVSTERKLRVCLLYTSDAADE